MTTLTTAEDGRALLPTRTQLLAQTAEPTPEPTPEPTSVERVERVEAIDLAALTQSVADRLATRPGVASALAAYPNAASFAVAVRNGSADPAALAEFAIVNQITTDNPGVIHPAWVNDVKGIVDRGTRAITALGGPASIGESGMQLNWPYFDGDLATIVGEQHAQKTDVTSVKVSLKKGSADLGTFAGGSDLAWQLIERSDPSYLDAYLRILAAAFAVTTDADFADSLVTYGTGGTGTSGATVAPDTTTAAKFAAQVFEASLIVDDATGNPASAVLASRDVFAKLGALSDLWPARYGTSNTKGTADAATLGVEVAGLPVTYVPGLPSATAVVTNSLAARWHGTGAMFAEQDDVLRLGRDVVVWGMGAAAVYVPAGVVRFKAP